jgi:hypothetical protein
MGRMVVPLRNKDIIRLENKKHVPPFHEDGGPNCYLPPNGTTILPIVKRNIVTNNKALKFLKAIGVPEIDLVAEVIERLLPKYMNSQNILEQEHKDEIDKILQALKTGDQEKKERLVDKLKSTPFLQSKREDSENKTFERPKDVYLLTPELKGYFWNKLNTKFLNEERGLEEWLKIGVEDKPRVIPFERKLTNKENKIIRGNSGCTRIIATIDFDLDGLDNYLNINKGIIDHDLLTKRALILWNFLLNHLEKLPNYAKDNIFQGIHKWFYYSEHTGHFTASWVKKLQIASWLPTKLKKVASPNEISLEELPPEFRRDELLRKWLMMKSDDIAFLADKIGINISDLELLKRFPNEFEIWRDQVCKITEFPVLLTTNKTRREEKVIEEYSEAPNRTYETVERSLRTSKPCVDATVSLRSMYHNPQDQMICQICQNEMPFKKRDNDYYFESIEIIKGERREHEALYIALCPICAAKYKEYVKTNPQKMAEIKEHIINSEEFEVPIDLDTPNLTIRFVEKHMQDLKTILIQNYKEINDTLEGKNAQRDLSNNVSIPNFSANINDHEEGKIEKTSQKTINTVQSIGPEFSLCPICSAKVKTANLERHKTKVHMIKVNGLQLSQNNKKKKGSIRSTPLVILMKSGSSIIRRCRSCNNPAMPGSDYCYSCK